MINQSEELNAVRDEVIDRNGVDSLYDKVSKHPLVTGGIVLAAAGLAYAVSRVIAKSEEPSNVARDVHVETSITINKTPGEIFAFWRDFKNLPVFMRNLESVTVLDHKTSHWVATGIAGLRVEWDAEIYNEKENELIAWRSLENSDVVNAGSVRFQQAPLGRGTYLRVALNYNPPAGKVGKNLAQLLGAEPAQLIKEDLRRLKQFMEAGEIATVAGQPSGRSTDAKPVTKTQVARL